MDGRNSLPRTNRSSRLAKIRRSIIAGSGHDQITSEGAYLQDSFNYQRMVLHQLLWTIRLAENHKIELDPEIRQRTIAALKFMRVRRRESGRVPNHGSNDGSEILPLAACDYSDFRPLLRMGSWVLNLPTPLEAGPWDEAAVWLRGNRTRLRPAPALLRWIVSPNRSCPTKPDITESAPQTPGHSYALVTTSAVHFRPINSMLTCGGVASIWREMPELIFTTAILHGTTGSPAPLFTTRSVVDRRDQMRRGGRFLWLDWAQASGKSFSTQSESFLDRFEGEHDGYRSLGVKHKRTVQCVTEDAWFIIDDLLGGGKHELRLHWLLPDSPVEVSTKSPFRASLSAENACFRWSIFSSAAGGAAVIRGGKSFVGTIAGNFAGNSAPNMMEDTELLGWESPTYGELCPAVSLLYCIQAKLPLEWSPQYWRKELSNSGTVIAK